MAHYQVILAYDGTHFAGYQRQARARTVQGVVEEALHGLGWKERSVLSAGRTDTGVHAAGQVIAFELDWAHSQEALLRAINAHLPEDVAAREIHPVPGNFHPRYSALSRRYHYRLFCQAVRDPLRERYAWRVWPPVDVDRLEAAAQFWIGSHDFAAFGTPPRPGGSTLRTIFEAGWLSSTDELVFQIRGNAFLYHMVRRLVFTQVQVGQARLSLADLRAGLDHQVQLLPGLAPACGLVLMEVLYPPFEAQDNSNFIAEGSFNNTLAVSGEDDRGQDLRP